MIKYKYLVIDFSNLFWRSITSSFNKQFLLDEHIVYNTSITSFFDKLKFLLNEYSYDDSIIYFVCDNPESHINFRKIISDGTYKHSREFKNFPKNIYKTLNILLEILKCYSNNFRIVQCDNLEADDLTYPLGKLLDDKILFISADLDWARNINNINNISNWYNYYTIHDIKTFTKKYGFSPEGKSIQLWKAIKGDNSDCIVNSCPYLPNDILLDILNKFKDVDELYENLWEQEYPEQWKIKLKSSEANIKLNYQLVDYIILEEDINSYIFDCKENQKKLNFWFDILSIPYDSKINVSDKNKFFQKRKYKRI